MPHPRLKALCLLGLLCGARGLPAQDPLLTGYYHGELNAANNRQFLASLQGKRVQRLVIDSPGGEVSAGIALGRWIFRNGIDVEVEHQCLSSCANYVFTAGRNKHIRKGAVVAWHGNYHHLEATGLWSDDIEPRMARTGEDRKTATTRVRQQVRTLVDKERDFFTLIGVDQRLCWVAKMPPHSVPDYYTLSVEDMAAFHLSNVHAPADYPQMDLSGFDTAITAVRLTGQ